MKKINNRTWMTGLLTAAFLLTVNASAQTVLSGWWGNRTEPDEVQVGIEASLEFLDSGRQLVGSTDGTYGTVSGATTAAGTFANGSNKANGDGTMISLNITNNSAITWALDGLHFDVYRRVVNTYQPLVEVASGSDITVGSLSVPEVPASVAFVTSTNWFDVDITLTNLSDRILKPGEAVTFVISGDLDGYSDSQLWIDNYAVTATEAPSEDLVIAGWWGSNEQADEAEAGIDTGLIRLNTSRQLVGSTDGSYGSLDGASTDAGVSYATGSIRAETDGTLFTMNVTNNSTSAWLLEGIRFDVFRMILASYPPLINVAPGGGITAGSIEVPEITPEAVGSVSSGDWTDVDIPLFTLEDRVLDIGESVSFVFSGDTNGFSSRTLWLDNFALSGSPIVSSIDGVPSTWIIQYFGSTNAYDAAADEDGDGLSNRDEYFTDTIPTDGASTIAIDALTVFETETVVNYRNGGTNADIFIEYRNDLVFGEWQPVETNSAPESMTNTYIHGVSDQEGFYRIRGQRNDL